MAICTATTISIRRATSSDLPQIADMMRLVSGREHSVEAVRTMTADFAPDRFYGWLAFADREPAGLTTLEPCILERMGTAINAGYWRYLWVKPDQRRTTLYPRLVFTMIADAAALGMDMVYGAIRRPEVAAGHLALGMQKVGDMPVLVRPLRPVRLFSKFHGFGETCLRLSAIPDLAYGQYLSLRRPPTHSGYVMADIAAREVDPHVVIPSLRDMCPSELRRRLTPETFVNRYYSNTDGEQYRVLCVYSPPRRRGVDAPSEAKAQTGWSDLRNVVAEPTTPALRATPPLRGGECSAVIVYRIAVRGSGIRSLVIMDMGHRSSDEAALKSGLLHIERRAIQLGCEVILLLSSRTSIQTFLRSLGYFRSSETYVLMKKSTRQNAAEMVPQNLEDWSFSFADHDAF